MDFYHILIAWTCFFFFFPLLNQFFLSRFRVSPARFRRFQAPMASFKTLLAFSCLLVLLRQWLSPAFVGLKTTPRETGRLKAKLQELLVIVSCEFISNVIL